MKYRHPFLFIVFFAFTLALHAADSKQDSAWKSSGAIGINLTQVSLNNWAGGGQNTIATTMLFNYAFNYKGESSTWENSLDLGYGMTKLGEQSFRKSDDRLIFISKLGYTISEQLSYAALLDLRTQFTEGLDYDKDGNPTKRISNLFAPANVLLGLGATYKPFSSLTITLAPLSNRLLVVADDSLNKYGAFGVDPGKTLKSSLGALLNITFKEDLMKNVTLESKLSSFAPYDDITHNLVNWNTLLTLKVNDYINASLAVDVVYDHNTKVQRDNGTVGPATQIRNVLSIGFGYKF